MSFENRVKKSFENLKKDIYGLKEEIQGIGKRLDEVEKGHSVKANSDKIFTSKPSVDKSMLDAVKDVFESGIFSNGPKVKEFEKRFAEFTGVKHAIAVANGTVAIEIVLESVGVKKGDEVIVPSFTTMPTIEPIIKLGAKPVFVDIDNRSYTLDPKKIENAISKKTKVVMPVHLYGNSANLGEIKKICDKHRIVLIEDCAQAHNTLYKGNHVGTYGKAGCFSFYPTKNLSVLGEGGMIITNDYKIADKAKKISNHGEEGRYNHVSAGGNYRLGEIHAAIGIEQLKRLNGFTDKRRKIARIYDKNLKKRGIIIPYEPEYSRHVYHLYVIRVDKKKRDRIIEGLKKDNIFLGIHYPVPCHMQKVVVDNFGKTKLRNTEKFSDEILSLPIYPDLSEEDAEKIAEKVNKLA